MKDGNGSPFAIGSEVWPGLSKLIEECGEVQQVCGKLLGTGGQEEHWDGTNLRERLKEELGDLIAAIAFVSVYCDLDYEGVDGIHERSQMKLALFESWHRGSERKNVV